MEIIIALLIGWLLDLWLGDPERLPHPVVAMGRWISFWEHRLNKGKHRKAKGAVMAVTSIALTFALTWGLLWGIEQLNRWGQTPSVHNLGAIGMIVQNAFSEDSLTEEAPSLLGRAGGGAAIAILVFFCLAGKTLRREVRWVFEAVDRSLDEGRRQVARIVGRDTQQLSAQEVRTAALETLAENLSDGVIAPLFWFMLLGVPGMMMYKMINTLDSMIGYHSERYIDFGCWAARIDDVANFLPARITALLMLLVSTIEPLRRRGSALSFLFKYGPQHASPNSGWPEAALAYILNCRFGGPHDYFGESFYKPYIGTNPKPLTTEDMRISLRVCFRTECLAVLLVALTLTVMCLL